MAKQRLVRKRRVVAVGAVVINQLPVALDSHTVRSGTHPDVSAPVAVEPRVQMRGSGSQVLLELRRGTVEAREHEPPIAGDPRDRDKAQLGTVKA